MVGSSSQRTTKDSGQNNSVDPGRADYLPEEELDFLPILKAVNELEKRLGISQFGNTGEKENEVSTYEENFDLVAYDEGKLSEDGLQEVTVEEEIFQDMQVHTDYLSGEDQVTRRRIPAIDGLEPEEVYCSADSDREDSVPSDADEEDDISSLLIELENSGSGREFEDFITNTQNLYEKEDNEELNPKNHEAAELCIGMEWGTFNECRDYIRDLAIKNRFVTKKIMNNKTKQNYICKDEGCSWKVYCSVLNDGQTFRCKSGVFKHTCRGPKDLKNPLANSRWVAPKVLGYIMDHPECKPNTIRDKILRKRKVRISYWTAWHARHRCLELIMGSYEDSYKNAPELCHQLLMSNPGSIATCSVDHGTNQFKGLCVAYKASLDGFVNGCRPILGIDGCFLKGKYGGMCLSIMSLDANNGLFPIAIYLCKNECRETWTTFLEIVADHLKLHRMPLTIISDRQKGLIQAVNTVFGDVNHFHRFCFRHMYKNFKMLHPGSNLEMITWKAAKSYNKIELKEWMDELEKTKKEAKEWMDRENVTHWARSHFDTTSKSEHITNNFSESFNSWIIELRNKPICKFVEKYHVMMMKLFYNRSKVGEGWNTILVPRARQILDLHRNMYHLLEPVPSTKTLWQVIDDYDKSWKVDLDKHTCTCGAWQISGIPCLHAMAVIIPMRDDEPISFVDPFHYVSAYMRTYSGHIEPLNHSSHWGVPTTVVKPPRLVRPAGRPRTQRRRDKDEQNGVKRETKQCGKCKMYGHNRKTCNGLPQSSQQFEGAQTYVGAHVRRLAAPSGGGPSGTGDSQNKSNVVDAAGRGDSTSRVRGQRKGRGSHYQHVSQTTTRRNASSAEMPQQSNNPKRVKVAAQTIP